MSEIALDVIVIGAGIAGLTAANALAQQGKRVAVVEARSRVGGRIHTIQAGSALPVELGAEFIHGKPEDLWQLVTEAGVTTFELDGEMLCYQSGELQRCERDGDFSILDELPEEPDHTFADWAQQRSLPPDVARSVTSYVEGFNAADARVIGTASLVRQQHAEEAIEGDRIFRIREGYASIAEHLLRQVQKANGELFLATVVDTIQWTRGKIRVEARNNADEKSILLEARRCVVTLPLGVLQAETVRFEPVPERAMSAARKLAMGSVKKIIFVFRERFWADRYPNAGFIFSENDLPAVWWTSSPDKSPILTGWIGGPRANAPSIAREEDLLRASLATLGKLFTMPAPKLQNYVLSWHVHDWHGDPFSRGAYSYIPSGSMHALHTLAEPVEDTLFFAGEHTDLTAQWGTVHAAMRSGLRAARQVLNAADE